MISQEMWHIGKYNYDLAALVVYMFAKKWDITIILEIKFLL
jgi:hypothetical protein